MQETVGNIPDTAYEKVKGRLPWSYEGIVLLRMIEGEIKRAGGVESMVYSITNKEALNWFDKESRHLYKLWAIEAGVLIPYRKRPKKIDLKQFKIIVDLWPTHTTLELSKLTGVTTGSIKSCAERYLSTEKIKQHPK